MKLFRVDVEFSYYIVAASGEAAAVAVDHVVASDGGLTDCVHVEEMVGPPAYYADGWEPDSIVYGLDEDLTLDEAISRFVFPQLEVTPEPVESHPGSVWKYERTVYLPSDKEKPDGDHD